MTVCQVTIATDERKERTQSMRFPTAALTAEYAPVLYKLAENQGATAIALSEERRRVVEGTHEHE
jgi:hypothetical protein